MTFRLTGLVTISVITEVEADNKEEALQVAQGRALQGLCHYCSSRDETEEWVTSGELDGSVELIEHVE